MKSAGKIVLFIALLLAVPAIICGCHGLEEVSREAVDRRYTAAYDSIETDYQYKYNFLEGAFVLVPDIKTVHHEEKYEVLYRVTYDNGSTYDRWETVGKEEWEEAGNGQGQNDSAVVRGLPPL